jgi:hypothetical protein
MSFFRRLATVSLVTASLAAGGVLAAPAVLAVETTAATAGAHPGYPGYPEPGWRFGPFEVPRNGHVSGGFSWATR